MRVDDVLRIETDDLAPLRSPVMVVALTGWFDIAGASTTALDEFAPADAAVTVAEIDPDPFYDFTQERPQVEIVDGDVRTITWPENRFDVVRGLGDRDVVVLVGVEPHLAWRTYAACIRTVAQQLGCVAVVTVGSAAEAVPHTRTPMITGSTTSADLAGRLGIGQPSYQGVTGVVGVIQADLGEAGIPSISLRVGIPHYLMNAEHPQAVAALQMHLAHVLGLDGATRPANADEIARWRSLHDEVVAEDPQLRLYVTMLEQDFDRRAEAAIPSADDLGRQFEAFLRDDRDE